MRTDNNRDLLKQALLGKVDAATLAKALRGEDEDIVVAMLQPDNTYSVEGAHGLTEDQMQERVGDRMAWMIKILPSPIPVFHSEPEVLDWMGRYE